jgi:hypothetical protein
MQYGKYGSFLGSTAILGSLQLLRAACVRESCSRFCGAGHLEFWAAVMRSSGITFVLDLACLWRRCLGSALDYASDRIEIKILLENTTH